MLGKAKNSRTPDSNNKILQGVNDKFYSILITNIVTTRLRIEPGLMQKQKNKPVKIGVRMKQKKLSWSKEFEESHVAFRSVLPRPKLTCL